MDLEEVFFANRSVLVQAEVWRVMAFHECAFIHYSASLVQPLAHLALFRRVENDPSHVVDGAIVGSSSSSPAISPNFAMEDSHLNPFLASQP